MAQILALSNTGTGTTGGHPSGVSGVPYSDVANEVPEPSAIDLRIGAGTQRAHDQLGLSPVRGDYLLGDVDPAINPAGRRSSNFEDNKDP